LRAGPPAVGGRAVLRAVGKRPICVQFRAPISIYKGRGAARRPRPDRPRRAGVACPEGPTVSAAPPPPSWCTTLRPLFAGLGLRPLLLLPVLLVLGIAWLGLGQDYGIPDQLWHENGVIQALAGFGAASVLLEVCFVAYLLDREAGWLPRLPAEHRG